MARLAVSVGGRAGGGRRGAAGTTTVQSAVRARTQKWPLFPVVCEARGAKGARGAEINAGHAQPCPSLKLGRGGGTASVRVSSLRKRRPGGPDRSPSAPSPQRGPSQGQGRRAWGPGPTTLDTDCALADPRGMQRYHNNINNIIKISKTSILTLSAQGRPRAGPPRPRRRDLGPAAAYKR